MGFHGEKALLSLLMVVLMDSPVNEFTLLCCCGEYLLIKGKLSSVTLPEILLKQTYEEGLWPSFLGMDQRMVCNRQVWAVNSAGHCASSWVSGRTGPAPPEGVSAPIFLHVSATSAVVDIHPPAKPNGIVSLYRVLSLQRNNHTLVNDFIVLLSLCAVFDGN